MVGPAIFIGSSLACVVLAVVAALQDKSCSWLVVAIWALNTAWQFAAIKKSRDIR